MTARELIDWMDGTGELWSSDGKAFLGLISSDCYASDSIVNKYGSYGDKYTNTSISCPYGPYGDSTSDTSARSTHANHPPVAWMFTGGRWVLQAYVTVNPYLSPRLDTGYLLDYLRAKGRCSAP